MIKTYLHCTITTNSGQIVRNPLKLGEAHLISKMAQENASVVVKAITCTPAAYKALFG